MRCGEEENIGWMCLARISIFNDFSTEEIGGSVSGIQSTRETLRGADIPSYLD
jgi:hypothetical protein